MSQTSWHARAGCHVRKRLNMWPVNNAKVSNHVFLCDLMAKFWTVWPLRWRHWEHLKHWKLLTQQQSATSQKAWIFSNTAVRTSNLTKTLYLGSTLICRPLLLALTYIILVSFELNKTVYYCQLSTQLHDIIYKKTIIFTGTTMRTSNLTKLPSHKPVCWWSASLPLDERTEGRNIRSL